MIRSPVEEVMTLFGEEVVVTQLASVVVITIFMEKVVMIL